MTKARIIVLEAETGVTFLVEPVFSRPMISDSRYQRSGLAAFYKGARRLRNNEGRRRRMGNAELASGGR